MKQPLSSMRPRRTVDWWVVPLVAQAIFLGTATHPVAADSPTIVRVEEDWELVVATPDPNSSGPQLTCVWSPTGNADSTYATFEVNHQSLPEFQAGGLQLQTWSGEVPLQNRKFPQPALMQQAGETVRWTQCVEIAEGILTFEIRAGTSTTWGTFGGQGYLTGQVPTSLPNLNGYTPVVSTENSGIGYAANRVQSLVLVRVRLVTDENEVLVFDTPTTVYPKN